MGMYAAFGWENRFQLITAAIPVEFPLLSFEIRFDHLGLVRLFCGRQPDGDYEAAQVCADNFAGGARLRRGISDIGRYRSKQSGFVGYLAETSVNYPDLRLEKTTREG